jgi:hypothetical protein
MFLCIGTVQAPSCSSSQSAKRNILDKGSKNREKQRRRKEDLVDLGYVHALRSDHKPL